MFNLSLIKEKMAHLDLDERSVALFRILLGISILYSLILIKFSYTTEFWGEHRLIPINIMQEMNGKDAFSIFDYIQNDIFAYCWIFTTIFLTILYTIGFQTKIVSFLLLFIFFNSSKMLPVEKELYNINALETLDISIPKNNTK
jgi:uncharacterized membrane protein YphA (DoxX/SURF4 family)